MADLTPKQQLFVHEYLIDANATRAAIRAGYSQKGARVRGAELLANSNVCRALKAAQTAMAERVDVEAESIIREFQKGAFAEAKENPSWGEKAKMLDSLVKHLGFFQDGKEAQGDMDEETLNRAYAHLEVRLQRHPEELQRLADIFKRNREGWKQLCVLVIAEGA